MAKYRKKPVVVDAFRLGSEAAPIWFQEAMDDTITLRGDTFYVQTLEGVMQAHIGDWVIRGVENELYPIAHRIFCKTYEHVEEV